MLINENNLSNHGGNVAMLAQKLGIEPRGIVDFSSNINPYGPPAGVVKAMRNSLESVCEYPEPNAESFVSAVADSLSVPEKNIVAGNGSIELIYLISRTVAKSKVLLPIPSFTEYELALRKADRRVVYLSGIKAIDVLDAFDKLESEVENACMALLGNPNNPCGYLIKRKDLLELVDRYKEIVWVIDEAFIDFVDDGKSYSLVNDVLKRENLVVIRSLTKIFSLAGIRLGYAVAPARISANLQEEKYPWSINKIAVDAGVASMQESRFIKETTSMISKNAKRLYNDLSNIKGLTPYKPAANFILAKINADLGSKELQIRMLKNKMAVRDCSSFTGLDEGHFRVAVKKPEENNALISNIRNILKGFHHKF